jgi:hypothetical protein
MAFRNGIDSTRRAMLRLLLSDARKDRIRASAAEAAPEIRVLVPRNPAEDGVQSEARQA